MNDVEGAQGNYVSKGIIVKVGEFCNREVVIIKPDEPLKNVAELMRKYHVGDVVLTKEEQARRIPIGIITDRDLVLEVLAPGLQMDKLTAGDISMSPLCSIHEEKNIFDALELMKEKGFRRLPVVGDNGALIGIITVDDIIELFTEMIGSMTQVIKRQQKQEIKRIPGL